MTINLFITIFVIIFIVLGLVGILQFANGPHSMEDEDRWDK